MGRRNYFLVAALLVMVAALIGAVLFGGFGPPPHEGGPLPGAVDGASAARDEVAGLEAAAGEAPPSVTDGDATAERAPVRVEQRPVASSRARIRGRLVDEVGRPAADVPMVWRPAPEIDFEGVPDLDRLRPPSGAADEVELATGRDGRFELEIAAGRRGRLRIEREANLIFVDEDAGRVAAAAVDTDLGDLAVAAGAIIAGRVVDGGGIGLDGVGVHVGERVALFGRSEAQTAADGSFELRGLRGGTHVLSTSAPNRVPATAEVAVARGEQRRDVVLVMDRGASITGRVVDDIGRPLGGARVAAERRREVGSNITMSSISGGEAVESDADGRFALAGIEGEATTVEAWKEGFGRGRVAGVAAGRSGIEIVLPRLATARGILRDESGQPISGSRVRAERLGAPVFMTRQAAVGTTDAEGRFEITGIHPGDVVLHAEGDAHRPVTSETLRVEAGAELDDVELIAAIGVGLDVLVVDADGAPVAGAAVEVRARVDRAAGSGDGRVFRRRAIRVGGDGPDHAMMIDDEAETLGKGETDGEGRARIFGLPAGPVTVVASHDSFAPSVPQDVALPDRGVTEAVVSVRPGGTLRILARTHGGDAKPAARYRVTGRSADAAAPERGRTDGEGVATVGPLPEGEYEVALELGRQPIRAAPGMTLMTGESSVLEQSTVSAIVRAGATTDVVLIEPVLATLTGTVTDANGPVAGAEVSVVERDAVAGPLEGGYRGTADEVGAFSISGIPAGEYEVRYGRADAVVKNSELLEVPPDTPEVRRALRVRGGAVRVVVQDAAGGLPVERADVSISRAGAGTEGRPRRVQMVAISMSADGGEGASSISMGGGDARVRTDENGVAVLEDVPPGDWVVRVEHDRFVREEIADVRVDDAAETDAGIVRLRTAGNLRGSVDGLGSNGLPPIAMVEVTRLGSDDPPREETAVGGTFRINSLTPGRYSVRARALATDDGEGWGTPVEVEVIAGEWARVRLQAGGQ